MAKIKPGQKQTNEKSKQTWAEWSFGSDPVIRWLICLLHSFRQVFIEWKPGARMVSDTDLRE